MSRVFLICLTLRVFCPPKEDEPHANARNIVNLDDITNTQNTQPSSANNSFHADTCIASEDKVKQIALRSAICMAIICAVLLTYKKIKSKKTQKKQIDASTASKSRWHVH